MVLSGLLKPSSDHSPRRNSRSSRQAVPTSNDSNPAISPDSLMVQEPLTYIVDESQLTRVEPEDPDLRDLNNCLAALAAIFPDVQVEVFREMLSSFDKESRLAVITETLLKNKMKWVRGRYMIAAKETTPTKKDNLGEVVHTRGTVPNEEKFRGADYKNAVKNLSYHEFKGLSRSTIKAVLAEHNHSYTLARPTLIALNAKSWRFSISSIFSRKKPISSSEAEQHPSIVWQSTGLGSIIPTLKTAGDPDLDRELFQWLIVPLQRKCIAEREAKDHSLAIELNNLEAEATDALHDCECCFTSSTFEELTACDEGGHFICFQCVRHAVNEAVFGQGWARNIDRHAGSLRCLAPVSDDCQGCIPQELIRRALTEEKGGEDILRKLDERLAEDSLLKAQLPLIRCPFCSYAEIDELYLPDSQRSWQFRHHFPILAFPFLVLGVGMIPLLFPLFVLFSIVFLLPIADQSFLEFINAHVGASIVRMRRRRLGLRFTCQNAACARPSCISCSKAWTDIHICHESSLLALRTQVELAMSLAIKRTCPRCNTSFVKSSGCNKLTCVCGYQMCYVCRKDIGNGEGYRHFCEHFRPNGGRGCSECNKCDLYRCEDDEVVVRKAKEEAERRWLEKEGKEAGVGKAEDVRSLLGGTGCDNGLEWWIRWKWPSSERCLDAAVEMIVE
jgi:hypothetical protein